MTCPDCAAQIDKVEFRGLAIHECPQCQGRWFGRAGLRLAKDHTDEDLRWLDFDPFDRSNQNFQVDSEHKHCPQCQLEMDALSYAGSGVVIDRCTACQGVWVHHGEFEKIIEFLEQTVTSKTGPEYIRDSLRQLLELFAGKEDVAEELRDFLVVMKLSEVRLGVEHPRISETIKKIYEYLPFL